MLRHVLDSDSHTTAANVCAVAAHIRMDADADVVHIHYACLRADLVPPVPPVLLQHANQPWRSCVLAVDCLMILMMMLSPCCEPPQHCIPLFLTMLRAVTCALCPNNKAVVRTHRQI